MTQMAWPTKHALLRLWRPLRVVVGFALVGLACWAVAGKSSELSGVGDFLSSPRWGWLGLAVVVELASYLSMASLQRSLLRAGGRPCRLRRMTLITFASNSIQSALPIGAGFAALYQFSQYQLLGADDVLAGWVVIAAAGVLFVTLSALAGVGLAMAASTGSNLDLVEAIVGVIVVALLAGLLWSRRTQISDLAVKVVAAAERVAGRTGKLSGPLARGLERMRSVAPTPRDWVTALSYGTSVWLADCACWACAFLAVGAAVPWKVLLLAYCAGQLAAILPITPGGLGVVEGTLTFALTLFGGGAAGTVAAVLLYRIVSFWIPLPAGAVCYAVLFRLKRRQLRFAPAEPAAAEYAGAEEAAAEHAGAEEAAPAPSLASAGGQAALDGGDSTYYQAQKLVEKPSGGQVSDA